MLSTRPRIVLFDLGNVLVKIVPERAITRFLRFVQGRRPDGAPARPHLLAWSHGWVPRFSAGQVSAQAYFEALDLVLGGGFSREELAMAWCDAFDPWPDTVDVVERVGDAGHPMILMSNTDPVHFAHLPHSSQCSSASSGFT